MTKVAARIQAVSVQYANVRKEFGAVAALEDFSLEIKPGEFVALLGPSGSGKTTALRILAGLESPTAGDVFIGEGQVTHVAPQRRDVAMVFQNYALYPHMNVARNLAYPLKLRGVTRDEVALRVRDTAAMLRIEDLVARLPRELSGGQAQRVALGRALIRAPRVFLMDEPLSNLDAKLRMEMRGEIKRLQATLGVTTLLVTHDQEEAMTLGARIAVMNQGRLLQVGTPHELYHLPRNTFVATFLGRPAMNLIEARLESENGATSLRINRTPFEAPASFATIASSSRDVVLGIRPEDVRVHYRDSGPANGVVELVEPVEPETHLLVSVAGASLRARTMGDPGLVMGQTVRIQLPPLHLYLFSRETGELLVAPSSVVGGPRRPGILMDEGVRQPS